MPRLSTSDRAKARIIQLIRSLLMYAHYELEDCDRPFEKLIVKWLDEGDKPKLLVQTTLNDLKNLAFSKKSSVTKEQIRHDLRLLKEFLHILDDHRLKAQGKEDWHFTINLWSKSTQTNLEELEREWNYRKSLKSKQVKHELDSIALRSNDTDTPIHSPRAGTHQQDFASDAILLLENLPARHHTRFVGSQQYVTKLLELLTIDHPTSLISIEGVGGIGKTALALEVAHQCWAAAKNPTAFPNAPAFDAIIFASAKSQSLVGINRSQRLKIDSNLGDILRVICRTLNLLDIAPPNIDGQIELIQSRLAQSRTLLIIDNIETLQDQDQVLSFLCELPAMVKVVLTSRVRLGIGTTISLNCLSLDDGLALIQHYAEEKDVKISSAQAKFIYQQSSGLPLAIAYGVGQLAVYGSTPDITLTDLEEPCNDFMQYCFAEIVQQLAGQPTYTLLMVLALFPRLTSLKALEYVALINVDPKFVQAGLATLHRFSLIESRQGYFLHPLTRTYINAELNKHPKFEQNVRNRWVDWYLNFLEPCLRTNWRDWQEFTALEQEWDNLKTVIEWCRVQERYDDFKRFWQQLKSYTQLQGYWYECISWTEWLMEASANRNDTETLIDTLYHNSRTHYLFNHPRHTETAEQLGYQALKIAQTQNNWSSQVNLTIHLAALCSQQQQFDQALNWLNQGESLLQQFAREDQSEVYQWIDINYYKAEIYLKNKHYQQAKQFYSNALKKAEIVGWKRAIAYTKGWLAAVAIAQGKWGEAEQLLNFVFAQARQHHDKRCLSICQSYWALLEKKRGNLTAAQQWARSAKAGFEQLNMDSKVIEMESFLKG